MADDVATVWSGQLRLGRNPASNEILLGDANGNFSLVASSTIIPAPASIQTLLDGISTTQGAILYRSASAWVALNPGISGYVLSTSGAGANPSWVAQPPAYTPTWTDGVKSSDQNISSSTTLTNVTDMSFPVSANTYYSFQFQLIFSVNTSGVDISITCPTGGTLVFGAPDGVYSATSGSGTRYSLVTNTAFINPITFWVTGYLSNGANAGTLQLQYSQNSSSVNNLTIRKGSWFQYRTV